VKDTSTRIHDASGFEQLSHDLVQLQIRVRAVYRLWCQNDVIATTSGMTVC